MSHKIRSPLLKTLLTLVVTSCDETKVDVVIDPSIFTGTTTPQAGYLGQTKGDGGRECNYATTWTEMDSFQLEAGQVSDPVALAASVDGSVYAGGIGFITGSTGSYSVIRKYEGDEKSTVNAFHGGHADNNTSMTDLVSGPTSEVFYTANIGHGSSPVYKRGILRGENSSGDFANLHDEFYLEANKDAFFRSMALDDQGSMYVVGYAYAGSSPPSPIFRKSDDRGDTWTAEELKLTDGVSEFLLKVSFIDGVLWVSGQDFGACTESVLKKSEDFGETWVEADRICASGSLTFPTSKVVKDSRGNLYYLYQTMENGNSYSDNQWRIRRSSDEGVTWTTVHTYQKASGKSSIGRSIIEGADGKMYAYGDGANADNTVDGVLLSSEDGLTWSVSEVTTTAGISQTYGFDLAVDAFGSLWNAISGYSTTYGLTWRIRKRECVADE